MSGEDLAAAVPHWIPVTKAMLKDAAALQLLIERSISAERDASEGEDAPASR